MSLLLVVSLAWWYRYSLLSGAVAFGVALCVLYGLGIYALSQQHLYLPLGGPAVFLALAVCGRFTLKATVAFRQRREYERSFAHYVSPEVLGEILAGRIRPEMRPERRRVSVLFPDIRGFTPRSEQQAPEVTIDLLNEYFEEMVAAVHAHGGTIDKFMG